jgi:hypothetical protein
MVGPEGERLRDGQSERLGRPKIDDQVELRRLGDGKVAGLGPLQDLAT